jgi:hypothetical protein
MSLSTIVHKPEDASEIVGNLSTEKAEAGDKGCDGQSPCKAM